MDAFFASVEQRDNPDLRGKPVAVGGSAERGVVAAASYEARRFGVRSAMASSIAKRKCPDLIFAKPRFDVYKQVSNQIRAIFSEYTPLIEPLSLDEAYLDVTVNLKRMESATNIAREIKAAILETTGLTASAGVSYNKFLAKLASDFQKPNGLFVIKPGEGEEFVAALPVGTFHGVGQVTAEKMHKLGIYTGADLKQQSEQFLRSRFGKAGTHYYHICRGIDDRPVEPDRVRKSSGSENTFSSDLSGMKEMKEGITPLMEDVWSWCERTKIYGRTITVKIKYSDFRISTKSKSSTTPVTEKLLFEKTCIALLAEGIEENAQVRLLGVSVSNLEDQQPHSGQQLTIQF
jgi:DNA polymerase-4